MNLAQWQQRDGVDCVNRGFAATLGAVDHWAKSDEDKKAVLLTTYRVAATYAAHYSAVRTAVALAAVALAYGVLLPGALDRLHGSEIASGAMIQSGLAAALMIFGQFFSAMLLARTNRARAVAISAQNRRDDDLLFHENSEEPGPPAHLDHATRGAWLIEPFPVFYEDLFWRFRGIPSGWRQGTGNRVYLILTSLAGLVFLLAVLGRVGVVPVPPG